MILRVRRFLLELLPKWALSRLTGLVTRIPLPRFLRKPLYGFYARRYGVVMAELAKPLAEYRSFRDFFVRTLPAGARPLTDNWLAWPCDGRVVTSGRIEGARIPQVKGQDYGVGELLASEDAARAFENGSQITIYLSPRDYHRVHVPFEGRCTSIRHVPGSLFPVNPPATRAIPRLFARNERVIFDFELKGGARAAVIMVAALNVGDIQHAFTPPRDFAKGDELGYFAFGSTTIVLLDANLEAIPDLAPETPIRMGAWLDATPEA